MRKQQNEVLLGLLAEAVDCREQYSPGGSRRVAAHALRFADALDLNPRDRAILERGALLRDIGKLKIPNDVLLKCTLLTYDEWNLLQQHTKIGANLVRTIDGLEDIQDIVRWHHECFDGTGYPDGLEGESIPLLARVVKIIDVYCAMTSPRLYRANVPTHEDAVEQLQSESGKHFDAELVRLFCEADIATSAAAVV